MKRIITAIALLVFSLAAYPRGSCRRLRTLELHACGSGDVGLFQDVLTRSADQETCISRKIIGIVGSSS